MYWSDREATFQMAGVGSADALAGDVIVSYRRLAERLKHRLASAPPHLRYYGGICFDPARPRDPRWARFRRYRFIVPRFEIMNIGDESYFICNVRRRADVRDRTALGRLREDLERLPFPVEPETAYIPAPVSRRDRPARAEWRDLVAKALRAFARKDLEKVVLARESLLTCSEQIDPGAVISRLRAVANEGYLFYVQPAGRLAFLGASPERLYQRCDTRIRTEALAGTRPRGQSDTSDKALGEVLLHNDKERREHDFVRNSIRAALDTLCQTARADQEVSLVRLRDCQHLVTRFEGVLSPGVSDGALLEALHPSPAVCGYPTERSLAWIRAHEPFNRGWYAGPVGWVSNDAAEFAVGIRSALVDGNTLRLYSGAGLVRGSIPELEWDEIENKIAAFLSIFQD
jgi:menaquinone-specific isochorismate synthase